jgi:signal transduction histidine kinase
MIRSLRGRVVFSLASVSLLILGSFLAVVYVLFRGQLRSELDDDLRAYATEVGEHVRQGDELPEPELSGVQLGAVVLSADGAIVEALGGFRSELIVLEDERPTPAPSPSDDDADSEDDSDDRDGDSSGSGSDDSLDNDSDDDDSSGPGSGDDRSSLSPGMIPAAFFQAEDDEDDGRGRGRGRGGDEEAAETGAAVDVMLAAARPEGTFVDIQGEAGTPLRAYVIRLDDVLGVRAVAALAPAGASGAPTNRLFTISAVALGLAVLVVAAIAFWIGSVAVRPLRRLSHDVVSLDEDDLTDRVEVPRGASEISDVAVSVNTLLARIEGSMTRERAFVADASHELRNPLASLRGELELAARDDDVEKMRSGIEGAIEETDRLARLADDLLLLARTESGGLKRDAFSLADVAGSAIVRHARRAEEQGVRLELHGEDAPVKGSQALAERAVENLIENALRYAPKGSAVRIEMWGSELLAGVDVIDAGPGIPPSERERVFDRFSRTDASRARSGGGSGLGLAIVGAAMRVMGGSVQLVSAEPGDTRFRLLFERG